MKRKPIKNEWKDRPPTPREVRAAQKMAKKVGRKLYDLMEANASPKKD